MLQLPEEQVQRIFRKIEPKLKVDKLSDHAADAGLSEFKLQNFRLRTWYSRSRERFLGFQQISRPSSKLSLHAEDKTGDGSLDKSEFWRFIETIGGQGLGPGLRCSVWQGMQGLLKPRPPQGC